MKSNSLNGIVDNMHKTKYINIEYNKWHMITTCCPMQYEKITENNNYIYVRYRWGILSLHIARSESDVFDNDIFFDEWDVGNGLDGSMDEKEASEWLKYFDFLIKIKGL